MIGTFFRTTGVTSTSGGEALIGATACLPHPVVNNQINAQAWNNLVSSDVLTAVIAPLSRSKPSLLLAFTRREPIS
jgi:hypothetical protein